MSIAEPSGNCGSTPSLCTQFAYNANGQRTQTTFPGGATLNVGYDSNWNATSVIGKDKNGTVLTSFTYTYNTGASDTELRQTRTESDAVGSNTYTYSYDAFNRLTQATVTAGSGINFGYSYDQSGNLISRTAGSATWTYTYNPGNELCWSYSGLSSNSCSSPPSGATTFTFDANGNQTGNSAGGSFTYNAKNQSTAITYGGTSLSPLTYADADQTQRTAAGATTFSNAPPGVQISNAGGNRTYFLRDSGGYLLGERIGSNHYYYLRDDLGSIVAVISGDGLTTGDRYGYDPYGNTTYQSGTVANPWGYAGGYADATGLIKFGTRYYAPAVGQFTQTDPLGQSPSPYAYAGDNPINATDPSGAYSKWCGGNGWTYSGSWSRGWWIHYFQRFCHISFSRFDTYVIFFVIIWASVWLAGETGVAAWTIRFALNQAARQEIRRYLRNGFSVDIFHESFQSWSWPWTWSSWDHLWWNAYPN